MTVSVAATDLNSLSSESRAAESPKYRSVCTSHKRPLTTASEASVDSCPRAPPVTVESKPAESRITCLRPWTASSVRTSCSRPSRKPSTRWR